MKIWINSSRLCRIRRVRFVPCELNDAQTVEKKDAHLEGAERVISAAKAEAQKLHSPAGVIAVVDDGGNLMAVERLDGTFSAGANISIGKAKTAVMFKKPTRVFEELINSSGKGRTVMTALENFTPLIGGIPIVVDGQIVGGVGVSGAATADQDEQLAIAGVESFDTDSISTSGDSCADGVLLGEKQSREAFAKGSVLFDGSDGRNYMVHASRREKPDRAEIHTKDADIIYVLARIRDRHHRGRSDRRQKHAPDELRGSSIRDGQTRQIAKGDVVIVPHGVPHQFLEVTNPFLYYVVKVR